MNSQRWQQVRVLFEDAVGRPRPERQAFLDRACGGDEALLHEVLLLLAADDDETPFLDAPMSMDALLVMAKDAEASREGEPIGPYRLVRKLGQGGMGTVYLAERADGQFRKQVALKLVRQGLHPDDLPRRLRHERQILASLDHPGIARLYDGGLTDTDLPYLVMEYVEGLPIDQYCDQHRSTTRQRLDLFRSVCEAVQYAHQNLVVHRDLKPSNILVTPDGAVKLLDFGIAKLLDADRHDPVQMTRTGAQAMTPEYASPEQVRGAVITTASDIYALGIILYELLTGRRPYQMQGRTPGEIEQVICEQAPLKPSTAVLRADAPDVVSKARSIQPERLRRHLRGDLDNIVMKALRKDPARRYGSAAELGEDLRLHLAALPVHARPDTAGYRLSKFIRRHTVGVAATVLILAALLGGILATLSQARVAERRFDDVRALANTLLFDLHDDLRDLPGATPARRTLVNHALTYLDKLNREAGDDPSLQLELAEAYERVGRIQGDPHYTNLGDLGGALDSYQKALTLREDIWQRNPSHQAARHALANSYGHLAVVTSWSQDNEEAITLSERALDLLAPLNADADPTIGPDVGRIRSELGWWLIWGGRLQDGLQHLEEAVLLLEALAPRHPENQDLQLQLWRAYSYQVDGLRFTDRYRDALDLLERKGLPHLQATARRWPTQPRVQYSLHVCFNFIGLMYRTLGNLEQAVPAHEKALHFAGMMVTADSSNRKGHEALARAHESLGQTLTDLEQVDEAIPSYRRAIAIRQRLYAQNPQNLEMGNMLGGTQRFLCRALLNAERLDEALPVCRTGSAVQAEVVQNTESGPIVRSNLGSVYAYTARIHRAMARRMQSSEEHLGHLHEALRWYDLGVAILDEAKQTYGASYTTIDWEVHPDTLAAERDALLRSLNP